jgi:hypothetical protein
MAEIPGSIEQVERLTGQRRRQFAYPNGTPGDYNHATTAILAEAGIDLTVTAVRGFNEPEPQHSNCIGTHPTTPRSMHRQRRQSRSRSA